MLNPYQRQSVQITLKMLEESLHQANAWLQGEEEEGILFQRRFDLTPEQRDLASRQITITLDQIRRLAENLKLEPEIQDLGKTVVGELSESWANLNDIRSKKLRRYGKVDPSLAEELDPAIHELTQQVLELISIFNGHSAAK